MWLWLKDNIGTIIVGLILLIAVAAIITGIILRKKSGKCIGCDSCSNCKSANACAAKNNKVQVSHNCENNNDNCDSNI